MIYLNTLLLEVFTLTGKIFHGLAAGLTAAAAMVMTGCSGVNFTIDGLLAAPALTDEQAQIHSALTSSVGRNITLKYPRGGANRSAFVIADLDGEPSEEALVFYEYTGAENEGIRMNLLDRNSDGSWFSVKELAGAGNEIEQVVISAMGEGKDINILVGYQNVTAENTLEIYSYSDGSLERIGADTYSLLETLDINSDGKDEIVTIQRSADAETGAVSTRAYELKIDGDGIVRDDGIDMCGNVQSYIASYSGRLENGLPAVYIDELNTDGSLQTEIIYYKYSGLQNPVRLSSAKMLPACTRPTGYTCADLEGNGVYLVPTTVPMLGYENVIPEEQVLRTTWSRYEDFYEFVPVFSGYDSVTDGYTMVFPQRWSNDVTVKTDTETGEAVFYKYGGDINAVMTELMRIKAVTKDETEDYRYKGYSLITSRGQVDYLVKLPTNKREQLILTIDEVQNNFYPTNRY